MLALDSKRNKKLRECVCDVCDVRKRSRLFEWKQMWEVYRVRRAVWVVLFYAIAILFHHLNAFVFSLFLLSLSLSLSVD
jgi:hypothetical protein